MFGSGELIRAGAREGELGAQGGELGAEGEESAEMSHLQNRSVKVFYNLKRWREGECRDVMGEFRDVTPTFVLYH